MSLHESLRDLVAARGRAVVDDRSEFRAALDDFLTEDEIAVGELNLLSDAVGLGAVARMLDLLELGAEPAAAVQESGSELARDRGTDDVRRAVWAVTVIGYALGRVPEDLLSADARAAEPASPVSLAVPDAPPPEPLPLPQAEGLDVELPERMGDSELLEFGVLGPMQVLRGGMPVELGEPKQRAILAALVLHANRVVPSEQLIGAAWGSKARPMAETALKRQIAGLQKALLPLPGGSPVIVRHRQGYELRVEPESVDLLRFESLVTQASEFLAADHYDQAARAFNDALRLWRGDPLADLPIDPFRTSVDRLKEARLTAVEDRLEAELGAGRHGDLIAEIKSLLREYPLRERLWCQLMLAMYRSGQRADALAAYDRAVEALGGLSPPGPRLRDLLRRIEIHDPDLAAPAGAARPKVKLPTPTHELVGRADDVAALVEQLRSGPARLVTLTGPGGVGKTRLAIEVATRAVDDYPGGVFFVSLDEVTDAGLVLPAVAAALEILEQPEEQLLHVIAVSLGSQPTLIVLDNLEQVPEAASVIDALVAAAPALRVIATNRRTSRIGSGHEYAVSPLGLPTDRPSGQKLTGEEARTHAAVELFVARSRLVSPEFELDDSNAGTVAEICSQLDGVPLSIELAAARSLLLSPDQLLARLGHQLTLLTGGSTDLPGRHRTLRATIDWSYQLLDSGQQQLLARLGAFAGTFSVDGAEVVARSDAAGDDQDLLERLLELVECSLVRRLPDPHEPRFRLLETVHEFARERLAETGEEAAIRRRLALHLLKRTEAAQRALDGPEAPEALASLRPEQTNLRAALEWAIDEGEIELAARLAVSLRVYWVLEGRLSEGRSWLARVLGHDDLPPALAARARLAAGILAYFQDDQDVARPHLETALESAREDGDDDAVAMSLGYLGAVMLGGGDTAAAQSMAEEASAISSRLGSYQGKVLALSLSAVIAAMGGDIEREKRFYVERLEVARRHGDCRRIAETLGNLADIDVEQGALDQARTYAEEALKLARGVARMVTRDALLTLGRIELASDRPTSAAEILADALRLSLDLGQTFEVAQALLALAGVASAEGDHQRAAQLFGAGDRLHGAASPLDVDLEPDMAEHLERTREALGGDAFQVAQLDGAALTLEDAAALALAQPRSWRAGSPETLVAPETPEAAPITIRIDTMS